MEKKKSGDTPGRRIAEDEVRATEVIHQSDGLSFMITAFTKTIREVDTVCRKNKIRYVIIGGIASIYYGCHRTTKDIDITVQISLNQLDDCFCLFIFSLPY